MNKTQTSNWFHTHYNVRELHNMLTKEDDSLQSTINKKKKTNPRNLYSTITPYLSTSAFVWPQKYILYCVCFTCTSHVMHLFSLASVGDSYTMCLCNVQLFRHPVLLSLQCSFMVLKFTTVLTPLYSTPPSWVALCGLTCGSCSSGWQHSWTISSECPASDDLFHLKQEKTRHGTKMCGRFL